METVWFCIVALMLALYVVFDGFDIGAGAIHLLVARDDGERRRVLRSIGPVWNGNEVWLLAAGGTLFLAFPALFASSFSGFYLPLMIVLWLLILRGISIELRNHIDGPVWAPFWDVVFSLSSLLLAVFYGAALGNVVRGVPLDAARRFFEPLWTDFGVGAPTGILDWYTVSVGLTAAAALVLHGALWLTLKTDGALGRRARAVAAFAWVATGLLTVAITAMTFAVQSQVQSNLGRRPWGFAFPLCAVAGFVLVRWYLTRERRLAAFLASCVYLVGMLTSAAFGLHPYVLPALGDPALGLTVGNAAAPAYGLKVGLFWWIPGMLLVTAYFVYTYRHFAGTVTLEDDGY